MERSDVLAKTAKGQEEIKSRSHGLAQKLRTLLIMIDGKQTVGALHDRFGGLGDVDAGLAELHAQGFVEVAAGGAAAITPQHAAAAVAESRREETLAEAVPGLCRLLYELLGPDADSFTGAIETARSRGEFVQATERAAGAVRGLVGAKKAERFSERARFILARYFAG